jgi:hypothetical protein
MRLRKTTTILAVALTATACGGAAESTNPTKQELAGEERSAENTNTGGAPGAKTPEATPPNTKPEETKPGSTPDAPKPATCDLEALNKELSAMMLEDALEQHKHFRCLCDDKGYPLVGNINAKGATASQFCSSIKEKGLL